MTLALIGATLALIALIPMRPTAAVVILIIALALILMSTRAEANHHCDDYHVIAQDPSIRGPYVSPDFVSPHNHHRDAWPREPAPPTAAPRHRMRIPQR